MGRLSREIQGCINRFEFVLDLYYQGENQLELHNRFTIMGELLKRDLLKAFRRHVAVGSRR